MKDPADKRMCIAFRDYDYELLRQAGLYRMDYLFYTSWRDNNRHSK